MIYQLKIIADFKLLNIMGETQNTEKKAFPFKLLFTLFFLFINMLLFAQEIKTDPAKAFEQTKTEITGTIRDLGTLPNIIVLEKGTDNFVKSDKEGNFLIKIPVGNFKNQVYLRFESLGMETREVEIFPASKNLKINMKSTNLDGDISNDSDRTTWNLIDKPTINKIIMKTVENIIRSSLH